MAVGFATATGDEAGAAAATASRAAVESPVEKRMMLDVNEGGLRVCDGGLRGLGHAGWRSLLYSFVHTPSWKSGQRWLGKAWYGIFRNRKLLSESPFHRGLTSQGINMLTS